MPTVTLTINGSERRVESRPGLRLLWALREDLDLTGTKYGCGEGQCGACTVLVDGVAVRSCQLPVEAVEGRAITTIEGLGEGDGLHPVQRAFIEMSPMQCGYCTPGMILSAVALLSVEPSPSEERIVEALEGNLCRCCAYRQYVPAVRRAAELAAEGAAR